MHGIIIIISHLVCILLVFIFVLYVEIFWIIMYDVMCICFSYVVYGNVLLSTKYWVVGFTGRE